MAVDLLNTSIEMLERMELDLADRVRAVLAAEGVDFKVLGVFSIEDMEAMQESDVCVTQRIAVGVGYQGSFARPRTQGNVDNAVPRPEMVDFMYGIILAVPAKQDCELRPAAGRILSALRLGIMGTGVSEKHLNGRVSRTWEFVQEQPNVRESSENLLYYSQVWRLSLPLKTSQTR